MAKKATLSYGITWYTPSKLKAMLEGSKAEQAQVRKEYTRLRDISQKRLKRLKAAGYANTEVYKRNVKHYKKLKDIKTKSELAGRLSDLSRFIEAEASTVTGIKEWRAKTLATLGENGYTFVNEKNLDKFGDFMEEYRNQMLDMSYDSGDSADLFNIVTKKRISPDEVFKNFEVWLANLELVGELTKLLSNKNLIDFMSRYKDDLLNGRYAEEDIIDLFSIVKEHNLSYTEVTNELDWWIDHIEVAKKLSKTGSRNITGADNTTRFKARVLAAGVFRGRRKGRNKK